MPPQLKMFSPIRGPLQKTIWKVALGLRPNKVWEGNYTKTKIKKTEYTSTFKTTKTINIQVCLKTPFVFLLGNFTIKN